MQIVGLITSISCSIARYNDEKKLGLLYLWTFSVVFLEDNTGTICFRHQVEGWGRGVEWGATVDFLSAEMCSLSQKITNFDILLTVYLSIILIINHLDAQNLVS